MKKAAVSVTARKLNKDGSVSKSSRSMKVFESITAAAEWIIKNTDRRKDTARSNICNASLGREKRFENHPRNEAYGYVWTRNK